MENNIEKIPDLDYERKRNRLEKAVVIMVLVALLAWFVYAVASGGCVLVKDYVVQEDGYFEYIVMGDHSRYPRSDSPPIVAIAGLTQEGQEQEAIVIPRQIKGMEVRYVGYFDRDRFNYYSVQSKKLKKLYIQDNIRNVRFFEVVDFDLMLCSIHEKFVYHNAEFDNYYYYTTKMEGYHPSIANIAFMNNYSTEIYNGYYWLDNVQVDEKIVIPPVPERSGYEFTGWYTEPECINKWDFDSSPDIEEDTVFKLYAGWRSM